MRRTRPPIPPARTSPGCRRLKDTRVVVLCLVYLGLVVGLYGIGLWLPQIVRAMGYSTHEVGLILIIPYALSALAMLAVGQPQRPAWRTGAACGRSRPSPAAAGLAASVVAPTHMAAIAAISLASMGIYAALGPFWSVPPQFLRGTAAAAGIALINSVGNLGGFAGPYLVGFVREATGRFDVGFMALAAIVLAAGVLVLVFRAQLGPSLQCNEAEARKI